MDQSSEDAYACSRVGVIDCMLTLHAEEQPRRYKPFSLSPQMLAHTLHVSRLLLKARRRPRKEEIDSETGEQVVSALVYLRRAWR